MKEQHGIYCDKDEWLGVLLAVSTGMKVMAEGYREGDELPTELACAHRGSVAFMKRAMTELGIMESFNAYQKGDMEAAARATKEFNADR